MGFHSVDLIEVTPGSANVWTDVDLDTHIANLPSDVCGVQLTFRNTRTVSYDYKVAARCNGSTDERYGKLYRTTQSVLSIGVDANKIFEVEVENTTYIDVFISGYYTGGDVVFFTNAVDESTATTGSYVDTDVSDIVSAEAVGVFGQIYNTNTSYGYPVSIRMNGSTDERYGYAMYNQGCMGFLIGVDANKIFEQKIGNAVVDVYVNGYIEDTAAVFNTNAADYSVADANVYNDLSALPDGAAAGIYHVFATSTYHYSLRAKGFSNESYYKPTMHNFIVVESAAEGKVANLAVGFWLVGYFLAESSGSYTLTANPGSFTLNGTKASLLKSKLLSVTNGSFALSGGAVNLLQSRILSCSPGSHTLAGTQANLLQSRILSGAPGGYILTGQPVYLIYTPAGAAVLVCRPGSFAIQGQTANMLASRVLSCNPGALEITGPAGGLLASRVLSCGTGALELVGGAGGLLAARVLSCSSASLELAGVSAILAAARLITCHSGALGMTGGIGGLLASRVLSCNPGALEMAGVPVQLIYTPVGVVILVCRPGSFTLGGGPAQLLTSRRLEAGPGTFDVTGGTGGLLASRRIGAGAGSFGLSAGSAMLLASRRLGGLPGEIVLVGEPIKLIFTPWGTYYVPRRADSGIIKVWPQQSLIIKTISGDGEL